ncbi:anhydro-N-acetylmuramic acid kinase [Pedobacter gandavensis]|uniref:anhydro-N-acetylmuramic acid kinase n=1 Tax=Pedobacter gandavensis TaxID=2679963 RepID=UPI0029312CE1|nr:anhydro-N-acetylmuramic acid kinase [Pedobacter gandavensis]
MNSNWKQLFEILQKPTRLIIGLMSGTSLDGLDIALCSVKGAGPATNIKVLEFTTVPYTEEFKIEVKSVFSKRAADLQMICLMNEKIGLQHAELVLEALKSWGRTADEIDVIASHGQTIFHAPETLHGLIDYPNATLQIGDGDHIAVKTGIITIADFRQKHLAAGGEGAPLAVYGDYLLFSKAGEDRIMLNIGGIANFTYLPGDNDAKKVFSTDVGPGNTMMDQYIQQQYSGLYFDENAAIASQGVVNEALLTVLLENEFLAADFPKTTGPELFNLHYLSAAQAKSGTSNLKQADVLATLCACSARIIVNAIQQCFGTSAKPYIYMSGGGMHNPLLVSMLKAGLPEAKFGTTADLGIDPDAKEAVLFALLANETLVGEKTDFGDREGVPSIRMGKICLPD